MSPVVWLVVFVVMLIVEGAAPGLVSIWFAGGAAVAFVLNLCGVSLAIQIIAFIFASAACILLLRPLAKRYINDKKTPTNADAFVGLEGIVVQEIDDVKGTGQVKVKGQVWTARSADGSRIPEGTSVVSVEISGAKLIVTRPAEDVSSEG